MRWTVAHKLEVVFVWNIGRGIYIPPKIVVERMLLYVSRGEHLQWMNRKKYVRNLIA
jgi:hypothetical protein